MAVTPAAVTGAIIAAGPLLKGPLWFQTASAIGVGVVAWSVIPANVVLAGSVNGTAGGGAVTGKFVLPPVPLPVTASVSLRRFFGLNAPQVASAVGIGIGSSYSATGQYVGTSVGAVGVDASKVIIANGATLVPALIASMSSRAIIGAAAPQLASALAPGIATMFMTGFGTGAALGPTGPAPGTGVSRSSVI